MGIPIITLTTKETQDIIQILDGGRIPEPDRTPAKAIAARLRAAIIQAIYAAEEKEYAHQIQTQGGKNK